MNLKDMDRPPCWRAGTVCPNKCAAAYYWRTVWNHTALHGPWAGWRLAGARLVTPSGEWVTPGLVERWTYAHWRLHGHAKSVNRRSAPSPALSAHQPAEGAGGDPVGTTGRDRKEQAHGTR